MRQPGNKTIPDGIGNHHKNNRDGLRLSFKRRGYRSALREDDIGLQANQFFRMHLCDPGVATAPTNLRLKIATFDPTQSRECLCKSGKLYFSLSVVLYAHQNTKAPSRARLLCASNQRASRRRYSAQKSDEFTSLHFRSD